MEAQYLVALSLLVVYILYKQLSPTHHQKNLPPGPPSLPIIGHFHLLKKPIHTSIDNLLQKYGPIISLRFGSRLAVVVSSPTAIKECLTKNDIIFANRPHLLIGKHLYYNYTAIGMAPYDDHWRNLRRFTSIKVFSTRRLVMSSSIRQDEVRIVVREMFKASIAEFKKVDMKSIFGKFSFNVMFRMLCSKPFFSEEEMIDPRKDIEKLDQLRSTFSPEGIYGLGDFFPLLKFVDRWRVEKLMLQIFEKREKIMEKMIAGCRGRRLTTSSYCSSLSTTDTKDDMKEEDDRAVLDDLLSMQEKEPENYSDNIIKGILVALLSAGSDTSASTMEWVMSFLLNHLHVLQKARDEIECNVGSDRLLNESDLDKLPYLSCIIKETLRIRSLGPFLGPHESAEDCTLEGYYIPKGTMLLVYKHALHIDPKVWPEPLMFKPERFETRIEETEGCKWIPFGMGRRGCPGETLGMRTVGLMVGVLIQCFEWERVGGEVVDIVAKTGRPVETKLKPLEAMYKPHAALLHVISQL
ncbi:unspecific monooxygenase [Ranunculus cassubicifolius]